MCRSSRRHQLLCGLVVVHLVGAAGMLVALQGWRSRVVNVDLIPHVESARAFLAHGSLPDHGTLSGFASYIPPGVTWLFLPGVMAFQDVRLFETVGSGLLFIGTLVGVLFLAYEVWGLRCALLAVGLYGLSELGLQFAGSLWPRGHPFFYVWMIYWVHRWIGCRQARYLAAALITWAAGMYVFLELAPALLVLPVMWLWHRPPARLAPLTIAVAVSLIIWFPYLAFEARRDFVDLRSQVLQQHILPIPFQQSWCDPGLTRLRDRQEPDVPQGSLAPSLGSRLLLRGKALVWGLTYNFERVVRAPGASLFLLVISSLTVLQLTPGSTATWPRGAHPWLRPLGLVLILCAVLVDLARLLTTYGYLAPLTGEMLALWQLVLGLSGFVLFLGTWDRGLTCDRQPRHSRLASESDPIAPRAKVLVVSFLIPWGILLLLAEPNPYLLGGERRFWWLWPLQVILLAAAVTHVLPEWGASRRLVATLRGALVLAVLLNPLTHSRVEAWLRTGWSGLDAPEVQTVDFIAEELRREGKTRAAIGYQTLYVDLPAFNFFMADFNVVDPRYKVGAEFDLLLTSRHGITNTTRCAEGIAADDEYRVVQESGVWAEPRYAGFSVEHRFRLLQQFGLYQVFKRS